MEDEFYVPQLSPYFLAFPNPYYADEAGLLAHGGDLSPQRGRGDMAHGNGNPDRRHSLG